MDLKTTFLHGSLEEEIYVGQPHGFVMKMREHLVCKLKKKSLWIKSGSKTIV